MSREGARGVRKMGSAESRREGEERRVRFVKCSVSRRITAKRDATGVFDIEVDSFETVNVDDSDLDIDRMC